MNPRRQATLAFVLFAGIFVVLYVVLERFAIPDVKYAGVLGHYGLPFLWAVILTLLLWVALVRAHIIPRTMSLRSWTQQEWRPARVYGILITLFLLSSALAGYFYIRSSREFLFPFVIASFSAVPLVFYWLYRRGLLYLVAGIMSLLLGLYILVSGSVSAIVLRKALNPAPLLGMLIVYALFFCWTGFVLIRIWRRPAGLWLGSWKSIVWGYLLVMSLSFVGVGVMSILELKSTLVTIIPIGIYLFFYSLGKFISSVRTRSNPALIDSYTQAITFKNFLRFSLADRSGWEDSLEPTTDQTVTLSSLTRSLFDVLAFVAVIGAFAFFQHASTIQQISFALLVITFHIAANLSEYGVAARDTVAKVRARLEQELKVAHDMQMGLMPKSDPVIPGFDFAATCVPANEVGGDFYDYVWLDEKKKRLGIAVADVSGKAMKAAMTAVLTSGMLYSEVQKDASPRQVLRRINHPLYLRSDKRVFTALAFAVIDLRTKELTYSSAGQVPPVLIRGQKAQDLHVSGLRLPLGIRDDLDYQELRMKLKKGDVLLFTTDGIVEAMNEQNEMYGFDRVKSALLRWSDIPAASLRDKLLGDVQTHTGNASQHDDMTVVVVRVL